MIKKVMKSVEELFAEYDKIAEEFNLRKPCTVCGRKIKLVNLIKIDNEECCSSCLRKEAKNSL